MYKLDGTQSGYLASQFQLSANTGIDVASYVPSEPAEVFLAKQLDQNPSQLTLTLGADDALRRLISALVTPKTKVLLTEPCFSQLEVFLEVVKANVTKAEWWSQPFQLLDFIEAVRPQVVFIASPNNPTGFAISADELKTCRDVFPDVMFVADQAYIEFSESQYDVTQLVSDNFCIVRTFSKAWRLPSLRIGYVISNEKLAKTLKKAGGPYSINFASNEVFNERQFNLLKSEMKNHVQIVEQERERFCNELKSINCLYFESSANFIFFYGDVAKHLSRFLFENGFEVRSFENRYAIHRFTYRISLPANEVVFERLLDVLTQFKRSAAHENLSS